MLPRCISLCGEQFLADPNLVTISKAVHTAISIARFQCKPDLVCVQAVISIHPDEQLPNFVNRYALADRNEVIGKLLRHLFSVQEALLIS